MALCDKNTLIERSILGILKETMGEDYQNQLTKRMVLRKDEPLIKHIKRLEAMLNIRILLDI